jgi:hypothetical protein
MEVEGNAIQVTQDLVTEFLHRMLRDYREMRPIKTMFESYQSKKLEKGIDWLDMDFQARVFSEVTTFRMSLTYRIGDLRLDLPQVPTC